MTESVQVALIIAVPTTLGAVGTFLIGLRTSRKADSLLVKTEQIHTLTNSNLAAITKELEVSQKEISGLRELVAEMVRSNPAPEKPAP